MIEIWQFLFERFHDDDSSLGLKWFGFEVVELRFDTFGGCISVRRIATEELHASDAACVVANTECRVRLLHRDFNAKKNKTGGYGRG